MGNCDIDGTVARVAVIEQVRTNQSARGCGRRIEVMGPAGLVNLSGHPSMEVLFGYLDPTAPYTQEEQAGGYLEAIHHHEDDLVRMECVVL